MSSELAFLLKLENIIGMRIAEPSATSYTSTLVTSGGKRVAQKVGEEAVELALASVAGAKEEQLEEAADLIFHLLILLQMKGLCLADVSSRLEKRHHDSLTE